MWPWQSRPALRPQPVRFDAVVDLGPAAVAGRPAERVMAAAETAVRQVPGAMRVRIRLGDGPALVAAKLFPPGRAEPCGGDPWPALQATVEACVIKGLDARDPGFPVPSQASLGFAEGPQTFDVQHFDALSELAALAQSVRRAPVQVTDEAEIAALAGLLGFVLPDDDRVTATLAVRRFGSYAAVLAAPEHELRSIRGLGTHSVAAIKLVHEAAVRLARAGVTGAPVLDDPARLAAYLSAAVGRAPVEQFRILFLDARGMLRADEVQAIGTVNHTPVYPREVVRRALELGAAAVILVHNHPSGDPTPSADDLTMTESIERAARALGIIVRDHVIVGNGRVLSFREAGLMSQ